MLDRQGEFGGTADARSALKKIDDTGALAASLINDLAAAEVTPAAAPDARGDEASSAEGGL